MIETEIDQEHIIEQIFDFIQASAVKECRYGVNFQHDYQKKLMLGVMPYITLVCNVCGKIKQSNSNF